jgi:hypothetical protein
MEMPNYAYPPDPKSDDPHWKDVTNECEPLVDTLFSAAEKLFGPRTKKVPLRITEFSEGPRTCFNGNGVAYIRLGPGVGPHVNPTPQQQQDLTHEIAFEIVHVLSAYPGAPMNALEKGAAAYFAANNGGYEPGNDAAQKPYKEAYEAVKELLTKFPGAIKELRNPPCSISKISADQIRRKYPECPDDLLNRLLRKW